MYNFFLLEMHKINETYSICIIYALSYTEYARWLEGGANFEFCKGSLMVSLRTRTASKLCQFPVFNPDFCVCEIPLSY